MKKKKPPPLSEMYEALYAHFGPQAWWPGKTQLEICVGAILTQNTTWTQVEKGIQRLKKERALTVTRLSKADEALLAEWLRPVGFHRIKAQRVKAFISMLNESYQGRLENLFNLPTSTLRSVLLEVKGIGPETADCILLYAAKRPVFVVDAYTQRVMRRHGWLGDKEGYQATAEMFTGQLPADVPLYNEFHALLVSLGKTYCRPRPRCSTCPLRDRLPRGGPRGCQGVADQAN